jgi:hypothetical protein
VGQRMRDDRTASVALSHEKERAAQNRKQPIKDNFR